MTERGRYKEEFEVPYGTDGDASVLRECVCEVRRSRSARNE